MDEEWKKLLFLFVFLTYLLVFLLKFQMGEVVGCGIGCGIWFCIQRVPTLHTFDGPCYPKNKKYLKNMMMTSSSHFSGIYSFRGSRVCQKYAVWVLVGCGIKFHIQRAHPLIIWVKAQGYMLKIRTKKSSFFHSSSKINNYYFIIFLRRPILDLKFPLILWS